MCSPERRRRPDCIPLAASPSYRFLNPDLPCPSHTMGSALSSTLHPSSLFSRGPLRLLITLVLVGSFGLLLVNSSLLSSSPRARSPARRPPFSDHATWSRYDRETTHPRPPDAPRDGKGRCAFQDPLAHLSFPVTSREDELSSALDRRRTDADGLVRVGVEDQGVGQHPMLGLIRDGERRFVDKLRRQSRTVEEARAEYERRNDGTSPPVGFDQWSVHALVIKSDKLVGKKADRPRLCLLTSLGLSSPRERTSVSSHPLLSWAPRLTYSLQSHIIDLILVVLCSTLFFDLQCSPTSLTASWAFFVLG